MTEQQVVLIVIAAIIFAGLLIGFYALKLALPAQFRETMMMLENQNKERMALIERNMDPSLADVKKKTGAASDPLFWGLLLAGIGFGAFLGYAVAFYTGLDNKTSKDALGLLFGGIGLVIYHLYKRKAESKKAS